MIQSGRLYLGEYLEEGSVSDFEYNPGEIPNTVLKILKCASSWFLHIGGEGDSGCILFYPRRQGGILGLELIGGCCHMIGSVDVYFWHVNNIFVIHVL